MRKLPYIHMVLPVLCVVVALFFMGAGASVAWAQAQGAPQGTPSESNLMTADGSGGKTDCRNLPEAQGGKLLGVIVPCVTHTMMTAAQNFSAKMIATLDPLVYIFMTLVVVLFGVKTVSGGVQHGGVNRLKGEAFVLVFKVGMVILLLQIIPSTLVPATYSVMAEGQSVVANAITGSASSEGCATSSAPGVGAAPVWAHMDCILGKMYGFTTGSGGRPNMLLYSSAFGFLSGFLFGGSFGVSVFLMLIGALWSLFMLVIRIAVAFTSSYLYICVLYILSPLFVPLMLLKQTQQHFDKWYRGILGSMLVPLLVSAYAMMALTLYDKVLFEPDSLFQQLFSPEFAEKVKAAPRQALDFSQAGNTQWREQVTGQPGQRLYGLGMNQNPLAPIMSGTNNPLASVNIPTLENISKEQFANWFKTAFKLLVTAMVISGGLSTLMKALGRIVGSLSSAAAVTTPSDVDRAIEGRLKVAEQGLRSAVGNKSGSEFVSGLARAPGSVMRGLIQGPE